VTNIPGLYAIGECDYQYHGANRLGANSLLSCIFSGSDRRSRYRDAAEGSRRRRSRLPVAVRPARRQASGSRHDALLKRVGGGENPYLIHQELGDVMTKAARWCAATIS
jgi:succinate dehydrogenase / fumarate reductase, flavoprotein subunit